MLNNKIIGTTIEHCTTGHVEATKPSFCLQREIAKANQLNKTTCPEKGQ